jgi:hypothetical protein
MGTRGSFPGNKAAGLYIVPRSKNAWSYTSTPQYAFMTWCLVKHRDNFKFLIDNWCVRRKLIMPFCVYEQTTKTQIQSTQKIIDCGFNCWLSLTVAGRTDSI